MTKIRAHPISTVVPNSHVQLAAASSVCTPIERTHFVLAVSEGHITQSKQQQQQQQQNPIKQTNQQSASERRIAQSTTTISNLHTKRKEAFGTKTKHSIEYPFVRQARSWNVLCHVEKPCDLRALKNGNSRLMIDLSSWPNHVPSKAQHGSQ